MSNIPTELENNPVPDASEHNNVDVPSDVAAIGVVGHNSQDHVAQIVALHPDGSVMPAKDAALSAPLGGSTASEQLEAPDDQKTKTIDTSTLNTNPREHPADSTKRWLVEKLFGRKRGGK